MANLFDYMDWRGGASFRETPFSDVDALCFAELAYSDAWKNARGAEGIPLRQFAGSFTLTESGQNEMAVRYQQLVKAACASYRFGECRACRFTALTDREIGIQFAAVCFDVPDVGRVVSFRGTDATIVGWRENFAMFYESPVPAQAAAQVYLERMAEDTASPLILTGHSKGGNLATYAAVHTTRATQNRIVAAWSFDGPGLAEETLSTAAYARVKPRLYSVIPEASVVGMLLSSESDCKIVRSDGAGLKQHNPFTWQLIRPGVFAEADKPTLPSRVIDRSMHDCLLRLTPQQREAMVGSIFRVLDSSGASTTAEFREKLRANLPKVLLSIVGMDDETRSVAKDQLRTALTSGTANALVEGASDLVNKAARRVMNKFFGGNRDEHSHDT